jgi:hypothetical protein
VISVPDVEPYSSRGYCIRWVDSPLTAAVAARCWGCGSARSTEPLSCPIRGRQSPDVKGLEGRKIGAHRASPPVGLEEADAEPVV